ncbi:MAG: hypothetical protein SGJ10_11655 [Bacteroidota bacterium]|nr:hypothetical protein [Bacteroidota bacterium]
MNKHFCYIIIVFSLLQACRTDIKGTKNNNKAPRTFLVCDTIARSGNNRLSSTVQLQWWGDDADGYISHYKYSFDGINWLTTKIQDSVFNLQIPPGKDTFDFKFIVKAVDNMGLEDPVGASLGVPVKNSSPNIDFIIPTGSAGSSTRNPIKTFPVLKYYWQTNDPDGAADVDHIELYLNDTNSMPVNVPANFNEVTLVAKNPTQITSDCNILQGSNQTLSASVLKGMVLDASNVLYIRSVDKVGAKSLYKPSQNIFVKKVHGSVLLVNGMLSSSGKISSQQFYETALKNMNLLSYDTLLSNDIQNNNYTELAPDNQTQALIFGLFPHIIWFTDDANTALNFAKKTLPTFFSNNGTLLMSVAFNSSFDTTANFLDFTPASQLVYMPQGQTYRLNNSANIDPVSSGWPNLVSSSPPFVCRPIYKLDNNQNYNYEYLYNAHIIISGSVNKTWQQADSTNVMIKRIKTSTNKTDFIITSVPLEKVNGNSNIQQFMDKALKTELGF